MVKKKGETDFEEIFRFVPCLCFVFYNWLCLKG